MGTRGTLRTIVKELIANWGMSPRKVVLSNWPKIAMKPCRTPRKHILCCELRTAVSVSVPLSLLFVSFLRILTDLLGLGIVTFLRIQSCVIEKSKRSDKWGSQQEKQNSRCVIPERPPTRLSSLWLADPFWWFIFFVLFSPLTKHVKVDPAAHNGALDTQWNPVTQ